MNFCGGCAAVARGPVVAIISRPIPLTDLSL